MFFLTNNEKSVDFTMQRLVSVTDFPCMYSFMSPHACMRLSGVMLVLLDLGNVYSCCGDEVLWVYTGLKYEERCL